MSLLILPSKTTAEDIPVVFNFGNDLIVGEGITGSTVTASVFSGTDPAPGDIISGITSVDGSNVTQVIADGVLGVIYNLVCTVTTSLSHVFTKEARLAVITPGGLFGQDD